MANFVHGVETVEVTTGSRPVKVVKAAVVGIIGTSAFADRNTPLLILNKKDAAQKLGPYLREYTLRKHVDKIFDQGGDVTVIAVNIYNDDDHTATVTDEVKDVVAGKFSLTHQMEPYYNPTVKSFDGVTTYVKNTDYTYDELGNFQVLNTTLLETEGLQLKVTYTRHAASLVPEADVIGAIAADGSRTGLYCFDLARPSFGFGPKMLLAPIFCETQTMVDELIITATRLRARALVDGPMHTVQEAITAHGPLGEFNFNTASKRVALCWPHRIVAWPQIGATYTEEMGLATFVAGAWVKAITKNGGDIHYGPSNVELVGSGSAAVTITGAINDATTEANALNEAGIICHLNEAGIRTWGNRSAAFPSSTAIDNFLAVLLAADVIDESIEYAMLPFIDKPMGNAQVMSIKETVNAFLNNLVGRGVVLPGAECVYDPADNPTDELAQGHISYDNSYLSPPPMERISFKRYLLVESLANIVQQ